jgi:ParB-like chromosome segregation protein Spo0J
VLHAGAGIASERAKQRQQVHGGTAPGKTLSQPVDQVNGNGGHRRYYAALELDIEELPVAVYSYATPIDMLAALVADNNARIKSNWQMTNEADALMAIASERAKERQGERTDLRELVPEGSEMGRARDEVGALLGVSGRTVSDMLTVKELVNELEDAGLTKEADNRETSVR